MSVGKEDREKEKLLAIFSQDVWVLISKKFVKTVPDYQKISSASLYFRTLLKPRITQILFPKVINILLEKQIKVIENPYEDPPVQDDENSIEEEDKPIAILPLRHVCRFWRLGVDEYLQDPEYHYQCSSERQEDNKRIKHKAAQFVRFWDTRTFSKFEQLFDSTHGSCNPFLCRGVSFNIYTHSGAEDDTIWYWSLNCPQWINFLQKYGTHIWYCSIKVPEYRNDGKIKNFLCCQHPYLLQLMPNLKALSLKVSFGDGEEMYSSDISTVQFPALKQLHFVKLSNVPLSTLKALLQNNTQVKVLEESRTMPYDSEDWIPKLKFYLREMLNVTRMAIAISDEEELKKFRRPPVVCRLTKLQLDMSNFYMLDWERIWDAQETHFKDTLTDLSLILLPPPICPLKRKLALPKLKRFNIQMQDAQPLEFLLGIANNLEEISVACSTTSSLKLAVKKEGELKVYRHWRNLQRSNVWSMFPKLRLLRVREQLQMPLMMLWNDGWEQCKWRIVTKMLCNKMLL